MIPGAAPWAQFGQPTVLRPAALPPDLPPDVPLPVGSRLIGSCTCGSSSQTLLDVELSPQGILRFYEWELEASGWYRHDMPGANDFLLSGEQADMWALYRRSPQGPALWIGAIPRSHHGPEIQVQVETDPTRTPCAGPAGLRRRGRAGGSRAMPLPTLVPPPGSTIQRLVRWTV